MKVTVIGTGYVGLPTGVGLAELGNDVVCLDVDEKKINSLKEGKLTIFEDGLEPLFNKHINSGRLKFSTSFEESIPCADLVILAVGTPPHPITKEADMRYIKQASEELAKYLKGYTVVAVKSTVPVNIEDDERRYVSALLAIYSARTGKSISTNKCCANRKYF